MGIGLAPSARPAARDALGLPALAAISPYVPTRPNGIAAVAFSTRRPNGLVSVQSIGRSKSRRCPSKYSSSSRRTSSRRAGASSMRGESLAESQSSTASAPPEWSS